MALYAMGDLHLSLNSNKSMEVFGPAWENYTERIRASLSQLTAEDVLVLAGDTSWGMSLEESAEDFRFLEQFPCKKYLIKGNHDYWWSTAAKFRQFCEKQGFTTLELLHNNCFFYGDYAVCGTRGWFLEEEQKPHNAKVLNRELMRLETSLKAAGEKPILCFLHYPPLYQGYRCQEIIDLMKQLQRELGAAIVLITHDLGVVAETCDKVAVMYLGRIMEYAGKRELYGKPLHPYTKALLSAIPVPDIHAKRDEVILQGELPSPLNPPAGCLFSTRCPMATEKCRQSRPELTEITGDDGTKRSVACFLYQ